MSDLSSWLSTFRQSAFRLETRDLYDVPQEEEWFASFRRGEGLPELTPENDSWLKLVSDHCRAGRRMQRVHLVSHPLSEYCRFELAMYAQSVAAGEEIRILERGQLFKVLSAQQRDKPNRASLQTDFWLFDSRVAVLMDYDDKGRFLRTRDATDPNPYLEIADFTLTHSVHLDEYLARTK
jgi:hypothetical protein